MQFLSVPGVCDYAGSHPGLALSPRLVRPSPSVHRVGIPICHFRSSIPSPLMPRAYASTAASRPPPQDWRSGGSLLLSCRTLSFPTACRFIPALGQPDSTGSLLLTPFLPATPKRQVLRPVGSSFSFNALAASLNPQTSEHRRRVCRVRDYSQPLKATRVCPPRRRAP